MSHDPLCVYAALYFAENCRMCRVIAAVREEEREKRWNRDRYVEAKQD